MSFAIEDCSPSSRWLTYRVSCFPGVPPPRHSRRWLDCCPVPLPSSVPPSSSPQWPYNLGTNVVPLHGLSVTAANGHLPLHYATRLIVMSWMCYAPPEFKVLCGHFNGPIPDACLKSALVLWALVMATTARLSYQQTLSLHRCTSQPLNWIEFRSP